MEIILLFSHLVVFKSLWPHGLQCIRPPCPSQYPKVCSSSPLLFQWCYAAISYSDALFSFCSQSFQAKNQLFASDDKNTGVSTSASVLPMNIHGWFPLRLTGLISLLLIGLPGVFSSTTVRKHQFFGALPSLRSSSHDCLCDHEKIIAFTIQTFVGRVMSLLFSTLSRFVIAFLPRGYHLLISWLQSSSTVILEPKKRKSVSTSTFSPSICQENIAGVKCLSKTLINVSQF